VLAEDVRAQARLASQRVSKRSLRRTSIWRSRPRPGSTNPCGCSGATTTGLPAATAYSCTPSKKVASLRAPRRRVDDDDRRVHAERRSFELVRELADGELGHGEDRDPAHATWTAIGISAPA